MSDPINQTTTGGQVCPSCGVWHPMFTAHSCRGSTEGSEPLDLTEIKAQLADPRVIPPNHEQAWALVREVERLRAELALVTRTSHIVFEDNPHDL